MNDLWRSSTVADLFYVKGRIGWRGLHRSDFTEDGPYLITGIHIADGGVQWDQCYHIPEGKFLESPEIIVKVGDMVITKDGTIGKVAYIDWLPGLASLNSHLFLVRPKVDYIDRRFAYHVFNSWLFSSFVDQQSVGSTRFGLGEKRFLGFRLPVPPIAEQHRIAEILDTADEAIRQTERLIAKLKLVKAGLLHDLLTRGLDEHGHLRDPQAHPEQFKDSPLGKIPGEWAVRKLANITTQVIDGTHFTPTYVEYGVPFLRVTDIQSEEIDFSRAKRIPEREHRSLVTRCKPEIGDILYSKNGTIGIAKLVDWDIEFSIFVSLALIKPIPSVANPHYLTEVLGSFHTWSQIRLRSKQMTVTNLHLEEIKEFLIPLPSLTEQGRIILALDAYAARIRSDEAALEKLRQVKRGLMDDLLTGRVRVKS